MIEFTTTQATTGATPFVVAKPVHLMIDGTEARSAELRAKLDNATMPRVRGIYAQAHEDNETLRLRRSRR